jgi:phage terminase large subunit-like protein
MPPSRQQRSIDDLLAQVTTGLRAAAIRPNVLGYIPHEKQRIFHSTTTKGRLYIGGNRSGKTTAGVVEGIWRLTGKHPWAKPPFIATPERPIRGRVVGVDYPNGIEKILLPEYARWTPTSELYGGSWEKAYQAKLRMLRFKNGSIVEFMSYDQDVDKFAGTSRDFVHMDEEPPEDIYNECMARLIDTGGPWWLTMTPVEGMTWIYDRIYLPGTENKVDHIRVIEAHMNENPHLSQNEVELYLSSIDDPQERKARGEGKFVQLGGLVFKTFNPQVHVLYPEDERYIPVEQLKGPKWRWYCSLDHGFNNPTAVLWHAVNTDSVVITFAEHYQNQWTVQQHAEEIHNKNRAHGRSPDLYVCDPALAQRNGVTGTSVQLEYNRLGLPFILGNNDVDSGISRMNEYLRHQEGKEPHWYIYGNCVNLVKEMARLRWKVYASKKVASQHNKLDAIHKKDDHAPDSARYFFTMMPELAPMELTEAKDASWRQLFSGSPNGSPIDGARYDENLLRERRAAFNPGSTEWTVVDEHMGGMF